MSRLLRSCLDAALAAALLCPAAGSAQPAKAPGPAAATTSTAAPATTTAPTASAQPDGQTEPPLSASEEAGRTFQQGRDAFKASELDRALALFQKSYALEATPGTLLNIALTEEKLGKTASALQSFERVTALLKPDDDRLPIARDGVARTTVRAPRLKIDRAAGAPPTLAITIDGQPLAANLVGAEQPFDPGPHTVTTRVYGFDERRYDVTLTEGQRLRLVVEPGKRVLVASTAPSTGPAAATPPSAARSAAFGLGGAGIAFLGVGAITGILAMGKQPDIERSCPDKQCDAEGKRLLGEGYALAQVSTGTLILGAAAVAAGATVLFVAGNGKGLFVSAGAGPSGASLTATGHF